MKRWMKRTVIGLVVLAGLSAAAVVAGAQLAERKRLRQITVPLAPVAWRSDAESIARGSYLYRTRGCAECHGGDGSGRTFIDDGHGLRLHAPNITAGPGSAVRGYAEDDWVRTIRHGVKPDGRPLMIMPSEDYNRFTDADLAAVVAYVRQLPAVDAPGASLELPLPVRLLYAAGVVRDAAEKIDHTLPPQAPVPEAVNAAHGAYVANACIGCHGEHLSGGRIPGAPPAWPAAANLTPGEGSALPRYPDAQAFAAMLRSGRRPDGSAVSTVMPFAALREMSDTDVQALYLHLAGLPPRPAGQR